MLKNYQKTYQQIKIGYHHYWNKYLWLLVYAHSTYVYIFSHYKLPIAMKERKKKQKTCFVCLLKTTGKISTLIRTLTLQSILDDNKRWAVLGNHRIADIPFVCPFHVWISDLGKKHFVGGTSLFKFTPISWGGCKKFLPW